MRRALGILLAVLLHAAVLLFGGLLFFKDRVEKGAAQEVELLAKDAPPEKDKDKKDEPPPDKKDEMEAEKEAPPDAAEIMRNLETPPVNDAPALEAASLSAIEAALSGQATGGDFSQALSFTSGGRIGGTGKAGSLDGKLENAFSLSEIDQKPRATFQAAPSYPADMRGKKVEGVVSVIFLVDASGKVTNPKVEKSNNPAFEKPALEAVRQWKFEPGLRGGQRVACRMRIPIRFQPS